jgi:hypothetical protein
MKKLFFAVLLSFSFILFPFVVEQSRAVEMSAGVSTWYAWWEQLDSENDMNLNPTMLYGPVLSLRFDETWSLAGVFLYGRFTSKDKDSQQGGPDEISRFDSDLSLNYNINRYFKIFGGCKFMGFSWNENNGDGTHWSVGPGLGIGSTLPLTNSLYLLFNVSGTSSWGKDNGSNENSNTKTTRKIAERGFNTNLSFAYYFASVSTSVNLGFRYQYLFIEYPDGERKSEAHNFFGPTFSVVYSF